VGYLSVRHYTVRFRQSERLRYRVPRAIHGRIFRRRRRLSSSYRPG
jgi:hypothetical protein